MGEPTGKTRWNSKIEAHRIHGALTGLVTRFDANGLDSASVKKAIQALAKLAEEVQERLDAEGAAKAKYREEVGPPPEALDELRRENEELKKRLAANVVR